MRGHVEDYLDALEFEGPEQVRAWVESQRNLTDREKRRALQFADQWEAREVQNLLARANAAVKELSKSRMRAQEGLSAGRRRIAEIEAAVSHDRLDPAAALNELGSLRREIREANTVLDAIEEAGVRAEQTANTPVDAYLADMRRRFPSVPGLGTQRLSAAYLGGEEPSPFTGGRS